jgi:hypothetical protein
MNIRRKQSFKPYVYIFIEQYFHAAISDKVFIAAHSITPLACVLETEGNPVKKSSSELSSR